MNLTDAINSFNAVAQLEIKLLPTRDGRILATLPRVGREIIVEGSTSKEIEVTATDVAWLCEEARRSMSANLALLEAAQIALVELVSIPG